MLACALWCAIAGAEGAEKNDAQPLRDKNGEPVQAGVFTSRWGRLFSGNDKVFSGALSFSSGLKEQWMTVPNSSDSAEQKKKYNQTLNLSLQYSPYSFWFANVTSRLPVTDTSRYTADFRYSFGYDDWHANTVSLVYSNYGDNHFWTFFIRATAFWYPDSSQQQPWNGDYSYSFGYAGYTPGSFSVQYANYAGTRYPGHDSGSGKFREGTISLIWFLPI